MTPSVHLCLVLHHHQAVGNPDTVFEQAYQASYLPFLDAFEPHSTLAISLHTSGPLMMWLAERHPEAIDRLRMLIDAGRLEILGGPQYEAILPMLPRRDRIGQIRCFSTWLERNLGAQVTGMWTPERVWAASTPGDMAATGVAYTVLDESHFRAAGLDDEMLRGYHLVEDDGAVVRVFPASQCLRNTIPFAPVQETIDHCWQLAQSHPGTVLTFAGDAQAFGGGAKPQADEGEWWKAFFAALVEHARWLRVVTLGEAVRRTSPVGKVYLPDCGPLEMSRRSLRAAGQAADDQASLALADEAIGQWGGGCWRNLRVKYTETNEMYAFMMHVSRRLQLAEAAGADGGEIAVARDHLYRGQCNDAYWPGASGGVDLPELRSATYHHLIQADTRLDHALAPLGHGHRHGATFVEATANDHDFDLLQEVRLANDRFTLWLAPGRGGQLYQWDLRLIAHNLLATMQRRHEGDLCPDVAASDHDASKPAGIGGLATLKQPSVEARIGSDRFARKSLMDHFYNLDATLDEVATGEAMERGDFLGSSFDAKIRRASERVQLQMRRDGYAWGFPISITKAITLTAGSDEIAVTYLLENLPAGRPLHFAVELNFAGMPGGADSRFFTRADGGRLGQLGERIDLADTDALGLTDQGLGLAIELGMNRRGGIWAFPVETISRIGRRVQRVQQSVCVMPHWRVCGDDAGRWAVQMTMRAMTPVSLGPVGDSDHKLKNLLSSY